MAIQRIESAWDSVQSQETYIDAGGRATANYIVFGEPGDTEADVRDALEINAPSGYFGLIRESINVVELLEDSPTRKTWRANVVFTNPKNNKQERPNAGQEGTSHTIFELRAGGGNTQQMTFSKELIDEALDPVAGADYLLDGGDFETALGLKVPDNDASSANLEVAGIPMNLGKVEIVAYAWKSYTKSVSAAYLERVADAAARNLVNLNAWKVFPAKTLKLIDYSANQQAGDPAEAGWDYTFNFEYSPLVKKEDIDLPGNISALAKDKQGHHYLDILWVPGDVTANMVMAKPVRAALHRLFDEEDYAAVLEI